MLLMCPRPVPDRTAGFFQSLGEDDLDGHNKDNKKRASKRAADLYNVESEDNDAEESDEDIDWEGHDMDKRMPKQAHVPGPKTRNKRRYMKCGDLCSNNKCLHNNSVWNAFHKCTWKGGSGKLQKLFDADGRSKYMSLTTGVTVLCVHGRDKGKCAQGCGKTRKINTPEQKRH